MRKVYNTFLTHKVSAGTNSFTGIITTTKRLYQPTNQTTVESLLVQCLRTSSESVVLSRIDFASSKLNKQNAFYGADVILRY
jgi:hypothetical protein